MSRLSDCGAWTNGVSFGKSLSKSFKYLYLEGGQGQQVSRPWACIHRRRAPQYHRPLPSPDFLVRYNGDEKLEVDSAQVTLSTPDNECPSPMYLIAGKLVSWVRGRVLWKYCHSHQCQKWRLSADATFSSLLFMVQLRQAYEILSRAGQCGRKRVAPGSTCSFVVHVRICRLLFSGEFHE